MLSQTLLSEDLRLNGQTRMKRTGVLQVHGRRL